MIYYLKLAFTLFFIVAVCHGATGGNRVVAHGLGVTAVLDATNSGPSTASSTGNVGHYDTNGHNGGSSAAYGSGDGQHSSCTCESSAGSNNGSPTAGTWWGRWGGGGGGSESGNYDGGYGSFIGSNGGSGSTGSGGGHNP